jgi:putative ABC transport system permease protein
VVVSAALAKRIWPDEDPIGQRIKVAYANADDALEVVGVVGDVRHAGLDADVRETIYYPATQFNYGSLTMVLRTAGPPEGLAPAARRLLREMDRDIPAEDLATMDHWVRRSISDRRDPMVLLSIFAALAVTIAAVGVYAVLSFAVSLRTREIGVRMALGAQPGEVLAMVVRGGLRLTLIGVALGAVAGMLAARALERLLFHVTPADPPTLAVVGALLMTIAMFAMYLPARRAARVDPMVALRDE